MSRRHTPECRKQHGWVHSAECDEQNAGKHYRHGCECPMPPKEFDCRCPIWFETNIKGKQNKWSSKEVNWKTALRLKIKLEDEAEKGQGRTAAKTVKEAIERFLEDKGQGGHGKNGSQVTPDTLYRHRLAMERLQAFCDSRAITYVKDITAEHLLTWRASWGFNKAQARASFQTRVATFFKFCVKLGYITTNPALHLSTIKVASSSEAIRHLSPQEYATLLATIEKTDMTPKNKQRIAVMMRLQREAGLSIVDAALFSIDELQKTTQGYVIETSRQKTDTPVSVPITDALAQELLTVKNGNPRYVFWSGNTRPEDAPNAFQKLYRRVAKKLDFPFSSHDLRHTFAISFLEAGGDIRKLSRAMGHSSLAVTEKFYGKWSKKEKEILHEELRAALPKPVIAKT